MIEAERRLVLCDKYNKNLLDNSEMSIYRKVFLELTDEEMDTIQKLIDGNE